MALNGEEKYMQKLYEIEQAKEKDGGGKRMKEVTGVVRVPSTIYYIRVGERDIEVPHRIYKEIMRSLANGDYWVFDEEKQNFVKYGTQLSLFDERGRENE